MPPKHVLTVRLSTAQYRDLEKLEEKLHLDKSSLIRFALARLAEAEGVLSLQPPQ
jgi:predicted transcriptional regulator